MTKDEAKAKIGKLLALANRPGTPAEGEAALARAEALAAKHGLKIQRKQPRTGITKDQLDDIFSGLGDWAATYSKNMRDYSENMRKVRAEARRKLTVYNNTKQDGYVARMNGRPRSYPGARSVVWGVKVAEAWLRGWDEANVDILRNSR
jgi:hypothetical protein